MYILKVLVEHTTLKLNREFLYSSEEKVEIGVRVFINFNNQKIVGFVIDVFELNEPLESYSRRIGFEIKPVAEILDDRPILNDELRNLATQLSEHYFYPLIGILQTMLPPSMKPKHVALNSPKIKYDEFYKLNKEKLKDEILSKNAAKLILKFENTPVLNKNKLSKSKTLDDLISRGIIESETVEAELKEQAKAYLENVKNKDVARTLIPHLVELVKASKDEAVKEVLNYEKDLLDKSVWIVGGDGWAYDIGYGGLDHVLASEDDVNVMVLDTEVYSNTGGQASKSSQTGQIAQFTASGKKTSKKNLALLAMSYGNIYVAQVALGANPMAAIKAFKEAESYHGPSLIICYAPCVNQGIKGGMVNSIQTEKEAVECGYFTTFRYDPRLVAQGKPGLQIDCKEPDFSKIRDFIMKETRYSQLPKINPTECEALFEKNVECSKQRWERIKKFGL